MYFFVGTQENRIKSDFLTATNRSRYFVNNYNIYCELFVNREFSCSFMYVSVSFISILLFLNLNLQQNLKKAATIRNFLMFSYVKAKNKEVRSVPPKTGYACRSLYSFSSSSDSNAIKPVSGIISLSRSFLFT